MVRKKYAAKMFGLAGINLNGDAPWDIQVKDDRFYTHVLRGSLGLGESYMHGYWDTSELDVLFARLLKSPIVDQPVVRLGKMLKNAHAFIANLQTTRRAGAVADVHYNLDHRLFDQFLGPHNQYSCCFFDDTSDLATAEVKKLEMICEKLELKASDRVLDIGSGWGGFARYAAETRGCEVVGISISKEQIDYATRSSHNHSVSFIEGDYRDLPTLFPAASFDKVVSCGMMEHVGYKNHRQLVRVADQMMKKDGLFLLHTIGNHHHTRIADPWAEKYIFPNGQVPSMEQLTAAFDKSLVIQDWENYGHYYARTLSAWQRNFENNWPRIKAIKGLKPFDERFRRMWNYYLLSCKAAFDIEDLHLWQIVLSHWQGREGVYARVNHL